MSDRPSDFLTVRMSAAGEAFSGDSGAITVATSQLHYAFTKGSGVRVLTSEWARVLSKENVNGAALFEIVPEAAAPAAATAAPEHQE